MRDARRITERRLTGECSVTTTAEKEERTMENEKMSDGEIRYFQGSARDFTPITVCADFAALQCLPSWNDSTESLENFAVPVKNAA